MTAPLDELHDLLGRVAALELSSGDDIVRLHQLSARLEAITTKAVGRFDGSREWVDDGAQTAAAWIRTRCRVPDRVAKRRVRLARAVRQLPHAEQAWRAGDLTSDHVALLAAARNDRTAEAMERDEEQLVEHAKQLRFADFQRLVCYWRQLADPDGEEDRAQRQVEDRRFDLSPTFDGAWIGDVVSDPVNGTILHTTLKAIERDLFHHDWADAKQRLDRDPLVGELARTPGQRRHDALIEMAIRARTAPRDGRRPAPLFTVLVDYETFAGRICELANRTVVTPGALVPYLDEAYVERIVFGAPSRDIDVSEKRRLFPDAERRGIQARDRECSNDFCDTPAEETQIDHIHPYAAGGPTLTTNGRCLCGYHNRLRHRRRRPTTG